MLLITCRDDKPPNLSYCEHALVVGFNSGFFPEIIVYVMPWLMNLRIKLCTKISTAGCRVRKWPSDDVVFHLCSMRGATLSHRGLVPPMFQ